MVAGDWRVVDARFRAAAARREESEADELDAMDAMIEARRSGAHERLGFGSFFEYAENVMGLAARVVMDTLRVAEALERLPKLRAVLVSGVIKHCLFVASFRDS